MQMRSLPLVALLLVALVVVALPAPARAAVWKLSQLGPVDGRVRTMAVAGDRLIFQADFLQEEQVDLFSMPIAGGAPARLNTLAPPGRVIAFQVSPDGAWVVFTLERRSDQVVYIALRDQVPDSFDGGVAELYVADLLDGLELGERVYFPLAR